MSESFNFSTKLIKEAGPIDPHTGAANVPIYLSSTFHQFDFDQYGKYDYTRSGNPTREALEQAISALEGGVQGFAFASGMAAISTAFLLLSEGDHVVISEDVYGGTFRVVTQVLGRLGISHTFVDTTDLERVKAAIQPNTRVIYIETPSNPTLKVTDIGAIAAIAKSHGCLTFVDNTFMTPALQRPLEQGADLVLHSATKFISGHSDVVAGLAVAGSKEIGDKIGFLQNALGTILSVQDSWLLLRGLKTLNVRMKASSASALRIAKYLEKENRVKQVYYPGLPRHVGTAIHASQAVSGGAVLSFALEDEDAVRQFVGSVTIPVFAVSLGAVESILSYPAKMSHAAMSKDERDSRGITDGLLRLSVGLEDADDLIADFSKAFAKLENRKNLASGSR